MEGMCWAGLPTKQGVGCSNHPGRTILILTASWDQRSPLRNQFFFRGNTWEQEERRVLDGLAFHLLQVERIDQGRLAARMPEKSLQDRHCDAGIPVVCAEGVTEPMPTEA